MESNEIFNRLKEVRLSRGLTQEDLAGQVGVSRQTIIAIEKAKFVPSVKLALELASSLQVSVDQLFWIQR